MVAISEDLLRAACISEEELRCDLALMLYQKGLPLMKAAELAHLDRFAFQHLLAARRIPILYDADDFDRDLDALQAL